MELKGSGSPWRVAGEIMRVSAGCVDRFGRVRQGRRVGSVGSVGQLVDWLVGWLSV